jgi:hypothetical protein
MSAASIPGIVTVSATLVVGLRSVNNGLPHHIITDLGSNFNNHQFWEDCENSGMDIQYVSVTHPRTNKQVGHANGMVLDALGKRLHDAVSHPIYKENASHMCARINLHTYYRQKSVIP